MSSYNNRINPSTPIYGLGSTSNRNYQYQNRNDSDRKQFSYMNRYGNGHSNQNTNTANKTGYKYAFYKDPNQYHYHSKDSLGGLDSVRQIQGVNNIGMNSFGMRTGMDNNNNNTNSNNNNGKDLYGTKKQLTLSHSPSFRRVDYKSRQFLDSIDNVIQSHRSRHSQMSIQPNNNNYQVQSQQILFLKQKLIQTHHKLLKQLQQTNRLTFQVQTLQAQLDESKKLFDQNQQLKRQLQIMHNKADQRFQKTQQKYRSIQNKVQEQSRRNIQLKDDLQNMRNKMLQTLMIKNTYQQQNTAYKNQQLRKQKIQQKLRQQIRQKDQTIQYIQKQLQLIKKKYDKCQKQCQNRAQQIHQYNHLSIQRQKIINKLQNQLKIQKDRNINSITQFSNLQSQYKSTLKKLNQIQDICQKYKGQIYWFQKNKQTNDKMYKDKLEKLTQQYNVLNSKYKQKQKQIDNLKNKPIYQAQKKRKNYQNTRQFVNRLENQQHHISQSRVGRTQSKGSGRGNSSNSKYVNNQATTRNTGKSPIHRNNISQNPITHQPITHRGNEGYSQQKSKYITMLSQVGDLQQNLLNYNMEKKRMLNQMDKIDGTKVKTKDMINKRRRLEDQINNQQQRIKRVKQQLKKIKAL